MATTQRPPRPVAPTGPDLIWPAVQFGAFTGEYNQPFSDLVVCLELEENIINCKKIGGPLQKDFSLSLSYIL